MKGDNAIKTKSRAFAIRTIRLYQFLTGEKKEYVMAKQLLRSGTSIGANVAEAMFAQTRADFAMKLSIAMKEAGETSFWLDVLHESKYLDDQQFFSINEDCNELIKLFQSITKTLYNK